MDKLRKIGEFAWYNKERIVFAVMVCVLCWHIYQAVNPPPMKAPPKHDYPKTVLEANQGVAVPPPPSPREPGQWESICKPNPFWYYSTAKVDTKTSQSGEAADIKLLRIQPGRGGRYRAQLRTANMTNWYTEGDSFESFELLSINPVDRTCQVRSERLGRVITLTLQQ